MKLLITSSKPCTEPAMSVRVASVKDICIQLLQIMLTAVSETIANLALTENLYLKKLYALNYLYLYSV